MIVKEILVIIKKIAITEVNLVKKLEADLEDINALSPVPIPNAPPSELCIRTEPIRSTAMTT
jgi:hypothetical protein